MKEDQEITIAWVCVDCEDVHKVKLTGSLRIAEHVYKLLATGVTTITIMDTPQYVELSQLADIADSFAELVS